MGNKDIILNFYREVFNAHDLEPIPRYVAEDYIQHNPTVAQGRQGFTEFCQRFFKGKAKHEIILCVAEDDIVVVFMEVTFADGSAARVTDIYRLENGMLAEHWDCLQKL